MSLKAKVSGSTGQRTDKYMSFLFENFPLVCSKAMETFSLDMFRNDRLFVHLEPYDFKVTFPYAIARVW